MKELILLVLLCLWTIGDCFESNMNPPLRVCVQHTGSVSRVVDDEDNLNNTNLNNNIDVCPRESNHCYTLWTEDAVNGTQIIMGQGCWKVASKPHDCQHNKCVSDNRNSQASPLPMTKFCCCSGDMCNENFTALPINTQNIIENPPPEQAIDQTLKPIIWISSGIFSMLSMLIVASIYLCWSAKRTQKADVELGQHSPPSSPEYCLDKLVLVKNIGQGRYGSVWRGVTEDHEVAVKVFPAHHRNYFVNEREMYKEAMSHVALLKCLGGGERITPCGSTDYLLILSLEKECLQEYLKRNTLDLNTLCKMSLSVAKGLAHLHSDLYKSCIVHRDLNSRNILVKYDLSCCICDLGLAVIPRKTENKSLSEAGTLRYMAPEVLEGAVNLRDCESALKQIDVYALGLVLWELGIRCTDMQLTEPPPYNPPFHKEAGDNPSLEQMQALVSRRKARPLWPTSWKDTASARLLCETAEDCWDQDAEARLTSLCVVERFLELPALKGRVLHPMRPPVSPTPLINNNHLHEHSMNLSVGTVETLLSPSEENFKNSNQLVVCSSPIQPYQGRNPCMERNLLTSSIDSLLIDKSSKHCTSSESQNLIANDYLNYQVNHRAAPISYVQNAVYSTSEEKVNVPQRKKLKWSNIRNLFMNRGEKNHFTIRKDTQVKVVPSKLTNSFGQNGVTTSLLKRTDTKRPSTLPLQHNTDTKCNQSGIRQVLKCRKNSLTKQRSLEQFAEVFTSTSDLSRLKDPAQRIKTPGDVPPSVRRTRGKAAKDSARFSLYDDRMMSQGQWGSAPNLEPEEQAKPLQISDIYDRDSVSSF
ncbi:activin receptor type-2A [Onthophagus taurus]|uniref:activin receptor type-2A n=1 Tax=Onthophagus taurus TaxID=166361 RepID=UPI000C202D9C|nr:bone morphogenetic protein receptor type-2 [Onthophagus taurus]